MCDFEFIKQKTQMFNFEFIKQKTLMFDFEFIKQKTQMFLFSVSFLVANLNFKLNSDLMLFPGV